MAELKLENSIVDDRYFVERCLGRGSYAEIFLAFDQQRDDLPVIIKALNATLQGTPDNELKRTLIENFQNEAVALDKVRHPHIIRRLGHGSAADLNGMVFHYLVIEYMAGGDLLSLCNKKPFTLGETLHYFEQIAEALAYAHRQQVIHRDIKPKNLLLSADHRVVKIADFGVAKMSHQANTEITRVGTDVYAPPEHHPDHEGDEDEVEGETEDTLTPSADVYSLAKTIYTAMSGRAPRQFSRRPISSLPAELASEPWGGALLKILQKATAPRAADRYATVQDFWQEFATLPGSSEADEDDADKTRVRSRLKATSDVGRPASQPDFQVAAASTGRNPRQARIVVELPERSQESGVRSQESVGQEAHQVNIAPPPQNGQRAGGVQGGVQSSVQGGAVNARVTQPPLIVNQQAVKRTQVMGTPAARVERGTLDKIRAAVKSDWLRRVFIIFLIATLVGLIASTYFYFAGDRNTPRVVNWFNDREGEITSANFVNLRPEPTLNNEAYRWLPRGTKIQLLEERNGWLRVRVTYVPSVAMPPDAPSLKPDATTGWIRGTLAQF